MHGLDYTDVFVEIPNDGAQETNLNMFIFPLLTNMCHKVTA